MIKDFLGHELYIGDECVYLRRKRSNHSFITDLEKGIVTEIWEDFVVVQDPDGLRPDYKVNPKKVVRVIF